ncbi:hypothetical protein PENTCL1PPCAC_19792, partial [Pristionchus entomophagus]
QSDESDRSNVALAPIMSRGFNAMGVIMNPNSNCEDLHRSLLHLDCERAVSLNLVPNRNDSTRDLIYGLIESLQLNLSEMIEKRNGTEE